MNIINYKNLKIFLLSLSPGLLINILILKTGHDISYGSYGCYGPLYFEEFIGWLLSSLKFNGFYISTYINYILLFLSQTYLFLIYNKKLKLIPLAYIGLLNCTYPFLNIHTNILKQGFAISFTIFCICSFISKENKFSKVIYAIFLSLLAYFSHISSILVLLIFSLSLLATYSNKCRPILIFKENQKFIYNIKGRTTYVFISLFLLFILLISNKYIASDDSISIVFLILSFFFFYFYLFKEKHFKSSDTIKLHNFILFFNIIIFGITIFGFSQSIIERLSLYIIPIMIVAIISISSFALKKMNLIYYLGILLLLFLITYFGDFYAIEGFYKC